MLTLGDFDYPFPEHLVAQEPSAERDLARLLVRDPAGTVQHRHIPDLTSELPRGTLLILNDTKVFPSRLVGRLETGGQVELFLIRETANSSASSRWLALAKPLKKLKEGRRLSFDGGMQATVAAKHDDPNGNATVEVTFDVAPSTLAAWIDQHGIIPLPPYIKRPDAAKAPLSSDRIRYQTVYAKERGSVAAPTAGLHFTESLLTRLQDAGIEIKTVVLHVGAGTFLPVKTEEIDQHRMHAEIYRVPGATVKALLDAKSAGRKVVAVGTTSFRSLEDLYRRAESDPRKMPDLADTWLSTELFIYPKTKDQRFKPWVVDGLITNFHQPQSTLFMLISALLGLEQAKELYRVAVESDYRLYSYGDTSLLWL